MGRRKTREVWRSRSGRTYLDCTVHPGAVLSHYIQWQRPSGGYATIPEPEPDTINVAVLAEHPVELDLDHIYYYRPRLTQGYWISFGTSKNPQQTLDTIKEPWLAYWTNPKANNPRPYIYPQIPTMSLAKDIPQGQRWKFTEQINDL
jgi:hypothetical protein